MHEPVLTVEQMRAAERRAMDGGIGEWELMQRAGHGAAQWIWRTSGARSVTVLCGPGNNGGDGYVIAEWLRSRGSDVQVIAPVEPTTETARRARSHFDGPVLASLPDTKAVLVDCFFGYGLSREVSDPFASLLAEAHGSHDYCVAVDVPSGVESDSGTWLGALARYDLTLALGGFKRAHFLMPASADMGACRLVPIGLQLDQIADRAVFDVALAAPDRDAHKYSRGLLAVVAGEMPGAPLLSCEAGMRAGAGYVKLLSGHSHPYAPADLVVDGGGLSEALADERISACLIGPGLGRDDAARDRLATVLESGKPLMLDADALHLLDWDLLEGIDPAALLLTPHEGELAKLCDSFEVTADTKAERAERLRDVIGACVLAKGNDTILATANGLRFFPAGPSWLSVAGSGDVLAGIGASRLAVHGDPDLAACEAVLLHNEAARRAGPSFKASDLIVQVPAAFGHYL